MQIYQFSIVDKAEKLAEQGKAIVSDYSAIIHNNSITPVKLEWTEPLPSGHYKLCISIKDVFEESQLHPLMVNYTDFKY